MIAINAICRHEDIFKAKDSGVNRLNKRPAKL